MTPKLLAFDTSTETLSVAVQHGDAVFSHSGPGGAQASATLIPAILALLGEAGLALAGLDAIVFGRGPGSFTGLRTACSVAQGLAFGANVPVLPLDTLLAVAEDARIRQLAPGQATGQPWLVTAALDARMDEMYVADYSFDSNQWRLDADVQLIRPENLSLRPCAVLAGNVFAAYGTRLPAGAHRRLDALPTAAALLRLAPAALAAGQALPAAQALPLYIRDKVAKTVAERAAEKLAAS